MAGRAIRASNDRPAEFPGAGSGDRPIDVEGIGNSVS